MSNLSRELVSSRCQKPEKKSGKEVGDDEWYFSLVHSCFSCFLTAVHTAQTGRCLIRPSPCHTGPACSILNWRSMGQSYPLHPAPSNANRAKARLHGADANPRDVQPKPLSSSHPSDPTYDNEIRLDLRFSMKFLMGVGVAREAINRRKARGVFSGFC
jgi:hypothetical protein